MYLQQFGLKEKPFSITPDPDFLFFSRQHEAALAMLEYGVFEQSGITVISGDVGSGKTTLIRHLMQRIPYNQISVGLISNVHKALGSLLQWVAIALALHYEGEGELSDVVLFRRLQDYLVREYSLGRRVVLIVDEAQNMDESSLEELRMLTNVNADKDQLLQVVLVGQPQLLEHLEKPAMSQIAQRVTAEYHLQPLTLAETLAYIRHRLHVAGAQNDSLFDLEAVHVIYYFSGGVPRLINTLCDHALVLAYAGNLTRVPFGIALDAVRQKRIGGIQRSCRKSEEAENARRVLLESTGVDIALAVSG